MTKNTQPASWVIVSKETGKPVFETFTKKIADRINLEKCEVVPIMEWLQMVNAKCKQVQS